MQNDWDDESVKYVINMSKVRDYFDGCLNPVIILIAQLFVIFCIAVTIKECGGRDREKERVLYLARVDSLKRVEQEEQANKAAEINENRTKFYKTFRHYYSFFKSIEDFDLWIDDYANIGAMELLHYMYSLKLDDFKGENGLDKMCDYLGWTELETICENCGETVKFEP